MFENILGHDNEILAVIVYSQFNKDGIHFFTPNDFSQQVAFMKHPLGKKIDPHVHNPVIRNILYTQEVLFIRTGRLRVDFFDEAQNYLESRELSAGDVILLVKGGHGIEVLEDTEFFEVKQGPYAGDKDKTRFTKEIAVFNMKGPK